LDVAGWGKLQTEGKQAQVSFMTSVRKLFCIATLSDFIKFSATLTINEHGVTEQYW
jgi:hypothetical protein